MSYLIAGFMLSIGWHLGKGVLKLIINKLDEMSKARKDDKIDFKYYEQYRR